MEVFVDVFSYMVGFVDVEELYGFKIGFAGMHKVEAVCFRFGEGAFVCSDMFVGGIEFEEGEEASHCNGCVVEGVVYFVGVDGGCVILGEDVVVLPLCE